MWTRRRRLYHDHSLWLAWFICFSHVAADAHACTWWQTICLPHGATQTLARFKTRERRNELVTKPLCRKGHSTKTRGGPRGRFLTRRMSHLNLTSLNYTLWRRYVKTRPLETTTVKRNKIVWMRWSVIIREDQKLCPKEAVLLPFLPLPLNPPE